MKLATMYRYNKWRSWWWREVCNERNGEVRKHIKWQRGGRVETVGIENLINEVDLE